MDKQTILDAIIAALTSELENLSNAAREARDYATDEESRAEDRHDTRAIEASYLADGQERAALETSEALAAYRNLNVRRFAAGEPIALTALVELEPSEGGSRELYFLGPSRGGLTVTLDDREILVITPQSPIGRRLVGRSVSEVVAINTGPKPAHARITAVE